MSAKAFARISVLAAVPMLVLSLMVLPVQAESVLDAESACLSCHEDLYYLHDTGKWYCIAEAGTRCIDCHGGDPDAIREEAAHIGLIVHPVLNGDTSKCQHCHPDDYAAHVGEFARIAGISEPIYVSIAYAPAYPVSSRPAPVEERESALYPWMLTGSLILIFLLVGTWALSRWIWRRYYR